MTTPKKKKPRMSRKELKDFSELSLAIYLVFVILASALIDQYYDGLLRENLYMLIPIFLFLAVCFVAVALALHREAGRR